MEMSIVHLDWTFYAFAVAAILIPIDCVCSIVRIVCFHISIFFEIVFYLYRCIIVNMKNLVNQNIVYRSIHVDIDQLLIVIYKTNFEKFILFEDKMKSIMMSFVI